MKIFVEAVRANALRHKCFGPFVDLVVLGDEVGGGSVARRRLREEESRPKKGSHLELFSLADSYISLYE